MAKKLWSCMPWLMLLVVAAPWLWEDFPTLLALYVYMTLFSILSGVELFHLRGDSPRWIAAGVPEATRLKWSRIIGGAYLLNAALWPLGKLLGLAVDFDQDFILITQMVGIVAVALLAFLPPLLQKRCSSPA